MDDLEARLKANLRALAAACPDVGEWIFSVIPDHKARESYARALGNALDLLKELDAPPARQPDPCGGCGAASERERCFGCLHDFGTLESAWVGGVKR